MAASNAPIETVIDAIAVDADMAAWLGDLPRSDEVVLETKKNIDDLPYGVVRNIPDWTGIGVAEKYSRGELRIWLKFQCGIHTHYQFFAQLSRIDTDGSATNGHPESGCIHITNSASDDCGNDEFVLTCDVEIVNLPQETIPSLVRLYCFETLPDWSGQILWQFGVPPREACSESGSVFADRKVVGPICVAVTEKEVVCQDIQARSEVMDDICNEQAPTRRDKLQNLCEYFRSVSGRICAGSDAIWLPAKELGDFSFELIDMGISMTNLENRTREVRVRSTTE